MLDRFWIDFRRIWRSFLDANWLQRSYQRRSKRVMAVIVWIASQKCCSGEKNAAPGRPGECQNPPWRGIGEAARSLMLENRSQTEGNLAAHLHFDFKSGSASLLKAPQSLPKGLPNRTKVVKSNLQQRIDKHYALEGGFLVSLDAKIMIFSYKFRRSNYQL